MNQAFLSSYISRITSTKLFFLLSSVVIAFLFFPFPISVTNVGVDEPLSYIFTYLMQGNVVLGKDILFPHGPLAFIMYPLPGDGLWWIAIGFLSLIRIVWAYSLMLLVKGKSITYFIIAFIGALLLSGYMALLLTIVQLCILFFINYLETRKIIWFIVPLVLSSLAFYIKAFVGIVSLSIVGAFFILELYYIWRRKEQFYKILFFLLVPATIVLIWFLLYGELEGLPRFIIGMQQLAGDNSAAAALYPDNLWVWLVIGMVSGLVLIFLNLKNENLMQFVFITMPALFAIWKYSMARQDYLHATVLLVFLFFLLLVFNLKIHKYRYLHLFLSVLILFSFFLNIRKSYYFETYFPSTDGVVTLIHAVSNYSYFSDTCHKSSLNNVKQKQLSPELLKIIGNKTVDVYPWDYSFLAANTLNWQPRPLLHSYASYTRKLDSYNAFHFKSTAAPEFLIWELYAGVPEIHGGTLRSIDGRYLLNDEPDLLLTLLSHYKLVAKQTGKFPVLLFQKQLLGGKIVDSQISATEAGWDTWVDVPAYSNGLMTAHVHTQRNFWGKVKSVLYKDDAVYCFYLLSDGSIRQYRVVPRTIDYGLWVNPLLLNPEKNLNEPHVVKICFRSMNTLAMKDKINISFHTIGVDFPDTLKRNDSFVYDFFGVDSKKKRSVLLQSKFDMKLPAKEWVNSSSSYGMQNTGNQQIIIQPEGFSPAFVYSIDSIKGLKPDSNARILSQLWAKATIGVKAVLVISIEKDGKSEYWKPIDIQPFIINGEMENLVTGFLDIDNQWIEQAGFEIKLYVWNTGSEALSIRDFSVKVEGVSKQ